MTRDSKGETKPIQNIIQLIQHAIAFWMLDHVKYFQNL